MHPARLLAALPDLTFGVVWLLSWMRPELLGDTHHHWAEVGMAIEGVGFLSAALMGSIAFSAAPRRTKALGIIIATGFFSLILTSVGVKYGAWWAIPAFWAVAANRLATVLLNPTPGLKAWQAFLERWQRSFVIYMLWMVPLAVIQYGPAAQRIGIGMNGYYWTQAFIGVRRAWQYAFGALKPRPQRRSA